MSDSYQVHKFSTSNGKVNTIKQLQKEEYHNEGMERSVMNFSWGW